MMQFNILFFLRSVIYLKVSYIYDFRPLFYEAKSHQQWINTGIEGDWKSGKGFLISDANIMEKFIRRYWNKIMNIRLL